MADDTPNVAKFDPDLIEQWKSKYADSLVCDVCDFGEMHVDSTALYMPVFQTMGLGMPCFSAHCHQCGQTKLFMASMAGVGDPVQPEVDNG